METTQHYTFAHSKGNYPNHLISSLEARGNWRRIEEEDPIEETDLYWKQVNLGF